MGVPGKVEASHGETQDFLTAALNFPSLPASQEAEEPGLIRDDKQC